jgi:hypothetical protein
MQSPALEDDEAARDMHPRNGHVRQAQGLVMDLAHE